MALAVDDVPGLIVTNFSANGISSAPAASAQSSEALDLAA